MSSRSLRTRRLCRDPGLLAVALDHSTTDGSIVRSHSLDALIGDLAGVAIGRNIFEAAQPGAMTRKIADVVHGRTCGR